MKKLVPAINLTTVYRYLLMPLIVIIFTAATATANTRPLKPTADPSIEGRWDMTVIMDGKEKPSWLEIRHSGTHRLFGYYVGIGGSARPISKINFSDGKMSFTIPPQWEKEDNDISFTGMLQGDSLVGTMVAANGKTYTWSAHRAPLLLRTTAPVWGQPIKIFNDKNLDWLACNGRKSMGN